jgi:uncharacterized protein (DUF849 family)
MRAHPDCWTRHAVPDSGKAHRAHCHAAPDIATLDLNTMTFGTQVVINTPPNARKIAQVIYDAGSKPEVDRAQAIMTLSRGFCMKFSNDGATRYNYHRDVKKHISSLPAPNR